MHSKNYMLPTYCRRFIAGILSIVLLVCLFLVPCTAHAAENTGWIEVRVNVPADFKANIIVDFQNMNTYEEYAVRVIAVNNYVARFEVPAGKYKVVGAFLESGDYRYNTVQVGGPSVFEITGEDDAAAILLEFKTTFNEAYREGADITPETEPVPETEATEPPVTIPEETEPEVTIPATEENVAPEETETTAPTEEPADDTDDGEDTGRPLWLRMLYSLLGTAVFVGVVMLAAYLYRRHLGKD